MNIEVYDNFLPTEVFTPIRDYVFSGRMPWYYSPTSVFDGDGCPQFSHGCYVDSEPISDIYNIVKPVFTSICPFAVHRIKFNATPRTPKIKEKPLHLDVSGPKGDDGKYTNVPSYLICVLFFNDNDGYTYFEDGQKVLSKENRAVIFPGNLLHAGTSCTDKDLRVVLNVDYCKWN